MTSRTAIRSILAVLTTLLSALAIDSSPVAAVANSITLSASAATIAPGAQTTLVAAMPVVGAGTVSQEIVQRISPAKVRLTSVSDIQYPTGWTLSYSTDGTTFTSTTPANAAAWAAVRAVKASGNVNSQGSEGGFQIATGTATGGTSSLSPGSLTSSGTGDGFQVFFDATRSRVFNVYHHMPLGNQLDCHVIATGAVCAGFPFNPQIGSTGQYATGRVVGTKIWIPIYTQVSPVTSSTASFRCVDISAVLASGGNPTLCTTSNVVMATGELSAAYSYSTAAYAAFQMIDGVSTSGSATEGKLWGVIARTGNLVCLDTALAAPCTGMPTNGWTTAVKGTQFNTSNDGVNASIVKWGDNIYIKGSTSNTSVGRLVIGCVLASDPTQTCAGFTSAGKDLGAVSYSRKVGRLVLLPNSLGVVQGACLLGDTRSLAERPSTVQPVKSASGVPCWDSTGTSFMGPASLSNIVTDTFSFGFSEYQFPIQKGSRIYWGNGVNFTGGADYPPRALCWDAAVNSGNGGLCANLPAGTSTVAPGYVVDNYTVVPDPEIDNCIWIGRDSQPNILTVDISNNVLGCAGAAPVRANFAGTTVVPRMACSAASTPVRAWKSFNITNPAPSANFSAVLTIRATNGSYVNGWQRVPITAGTPIDLSTLDPVVTGATPSFLVDFTVTSGSVSTATATVQAVGDAPELCITPTAQAVCPTGSGLLSGLSGTSTDISAEGSATDAQNNATTMSPSSTTVVITAPTNSQCGATLSGTATITGTSTPVANATVTLLDSSGNPVLDGQGNPITTTTASDGTYSFGYLFPGNYKVKFADVGTKTANTATTVTGGSGSSSRSSNTLMSLVTNIAVGTNAVVNAAYNTTAIATADTSTGAQGAVQTINVKSNDLPSTGNNLTTPTINFCSTDSPASGCTLTTKTVAGEGVYTLSGGNVVFTPCSAANTPAGASCTAAFTGTATPVAYKITDSAGSSATSTITPTVVPAPVASADTSTGVYNTAQTKNILTNDSVGAGATISASTVRLCNPTTTPAQTPNNCTVAAGTTINVPNVGAYVVNTSGVVTFTPLATFTGAAPALKYQVQDSVGQYTNSTFTPTVTPPPPPTAVADKSSGIQGATQTVNLLSNDSVSGVGQSLTTSTTRLCSSGQTAPTCTATTMSVAGEGNYSLNTSTGVVTFTPCSAANTPAGASCTGPFVGTATPVPYQVSSNTSHTATSTYTPSVVPPPTATADTGTAGWDVNQTFTPTANDSAGSGATLNAVPLGICTAATAVASCTGTTLTVANQGTYTLNTTTGVVTFDPLPTFTGPATAIRYAISDSLNQKTSSTITPTVTPPPAPTATAQQKLVLPGGTATFTTLTGTGGLASTGGPAFTTSATCLVNTSVIPNTCGTSLTIANEGTYTLNTATGVVSFVALNNATSGVKTPITYKVTDATGQTATSTLTPIIPPPPTAVNDTSYGEQNNSQIINILGNDTASQYAQLSAATVKLCPTNATSPYSASNCNLTTVNVSNQGKYTLNANGTVTFEPCTAAGVAACPASTIFNGPATPLRYIVGDSLGQLTNATINPIVLPPPATMAAPDTGSAAFGQPVVFNPLTNDSAGTLTGLSGYTSVGNASLVPTSVRLCGSGEVAPNCTATSITTPSGTYTVNTSTGAITFVPAANFTGIPPTVPSYMVCNQMSGTWAPLTPSTSCATSSVTPTIAPPGAPAAANDTSSGVYNTPQAINVITNDSTDPLLSLLPSTVKLCGVGQTVPNCSLTTLAVPGEGTYVVNTTTGVVTFTPLPSFAGTVATAPTYQISDSFGGTASATITPTVAPPAAPTATPQTKSVLQGATVNFTNVIGGSALASGVGLQSGAQNGPCIVDPSDSVCKTSFSITGEGTWSIDQLSGIAQFDADPAAPAGALTPITYRVTDIVGQITTALLTPVLPPPSTPTNDTSINALDVNQLINVVSNDIPGQGATFTPSTVKLCGSGEAAPFCTQSTLTVANEGTYTVNANGTVTFDPLPTFVGAATPIDYQILDSLGRAYAATITPRVTTTPPTANPDALTVQAGASASFKPIFGNAALALAANGGPTLVNNSVCIVDPANNTCGNTVTIAGQGTFTLNQSTGVVTYTAVQNATAGVKTPVSYRITDADGFVVESALTPTVTVPAVTPSPSPAPSSVTPSPAPVTPQPKPSNSNNNTPTNVVDSGAQAVNRVNWTRPSTPVFFNPSYLATPSTNAKFNTSLTKLYVAAERRWSVQVTTNDGTWVVIGDNVRFTPADGFLGKAVVKFQLVDSAGKLAHATLTAVVTGNPPILPATGNNTNVLTVWAMFMLIFGMALLALRRSMRLKNR